MMLARLKAIPRSVWQAVARTVVESRFGHLTGMVFSLRRRAPLLAILLGLVLLAGLYLAGSTMLAVFAWLGGWRWPHLLLAAPAALVVLLVMTELYAAAILSLLQIVLRLGYDIGRARFGAVLAIAALSAGAVAAMRLWSEQATPPASGPVAAAVLAGAAVALASWFVRTYLQPASRGFRSFHVDLVEARRALEGARHGA
jgi:MFS family permease